MTAYIGCIAGAIGIDEYRDGLREAGFSHVDDRRHRRRSERLRQGGTAAGVLLFEPESPVAKTCCPPSPAQDTALHKGVAALCSRYDFNEFAASVRVYAVK